jgi:hypothetical protein
MVEYFKSKVTHKATLPAWDGALVLPSPPAECSNGGACSASHSASTDSIADSFPAQYEPVTVVEYKTPKPDNRGAEKWSSILRRGGVKATPYERYKQVTTNNLVSVPKLGLWRGRLCHKEDWKRYSGEPSCRYHCLGKLAQSDLSTYSEQGDAEHWLGQGFPTHVYSSIDGAKILSAIEQCKSQAVLKSYRDFDALTELAQMKQTSKEFGSCARAVSSRLGKFSEYHNRLTTYRFWSLLTPKDMLRHASTYVRKVGSIWMAYRYFLMPLVYSLRDLEVATRDPLFTHDKAAITIKPDSFQPVVNTSLPRISRWTTGSVTVRASVACAYHNGSMPFAAKVAMNPLLTAWELIPYSFVIDWFVNIGDAIKLNLSMNYAEEVAACWSIRTKTTTTDILTYPYNQTSSLDAWTVKASCSPATCWPAGSYPALPTRTISGVVASTIKSVELDAYHRETFRRGGYFGLNIQPSMNWKRIIDSVVLSNNLLKGARNSFR